MNITPPSIKNETPINHDTNIVNNNTSQTNSSTANGKYTFLSDNRKLIVYRWTQCLENQIKYKKTCNRGSKGISFKKISAIFTFYAPHLFSLLHQSLL